MPCVPGRPESPVKETSSSSSEYLCFNHRRPETLTYYAGTTSFSDLSNPPLSDLAPHAKVIPMVSTTATDRKEQSRPITRTVKTFMDACRLAPLWAIGKPVRAEAETIRKTTSGMLSTTC